MYSHWHLCLCVTVFWLVFHEHKNLEIVRTWYSWYPPEDMHALSMLLIDLCQQVCDNEKSILWSIESEHWIRQQGRKRRNVSRQNLTAALFIHKNKALSFYIFLYSQWKVLLYFSQSLQGLTCLHTETCTQIYSYWSDCWIQGLEYLHTYSIFLYRQVSHKLWLGDNTSLRFLKITI